MKFNMVTTLKEDSKLLRIDTEDGIEKWAEINRKYSEIWPNITEKKDPPSDAEEWQSVKDKYNNHFSEKPGT